MRGVITAALLVAACKTPDPTLRTIQVPAYYLGYDAADLVQAMVDGETDAAKRPVRGMAGRLADVALAHDELVSLASAPAGNQARGFDPEASFEEVSTLEDGVLCLQLERSLDGLSARYWALFTLTEEPRRLDGTLRVEWRVNAPQSGFDTTVQAEFGGLVLDTERIDDTYESPYPAGGALGIDYEIDGSPGSVDITYVDDADVDSIQVSGF